MAIGSHGRGRGGTVGDGRLGRRPTVEKLFSFMRRFGAAAVTIDLARYRGATYRTAVQSDHDLHVTPRRAEPAPTH